MSLFISHVLVYWQLFSNFSLYIDLFLHCFLSTIFFIFSFISPVSFLISYFQLPYSFFLLIFSIHFLYLFLFPAIIKKKFTNPNCLIRNFKLLLYQLKFASHFYDLGNEFLVVFLLSLEELIFSLPHCYFTLSILSFSSSKSDCVLKHIKIKCRKTNYLSPKQVCDIIILIGRVV